MSSPQQNPLLGLAPSALNGSPANALMPPSPYDVTPAQGMQANAQAVGNFLSQQRAQSAQMGMLDPNNGLPTQAGMANAAGRYGNMLLMSMKAPSALPLNGLMPAPASPLMATAQAVRNFITKPNYARALSADALAAVQDAISTHPEIAHAVHTGDWSVADDGSQGQAMNAPPVVNWPGQ